MSKLNYIAMAARGKSKLFNHIVDQITTLYPYSSVMDWFKIGISLQVYCQQMGKGSYEYVITEWDTLTYNAKHDLPRGGKIEGRVLDRKETDGIKLRTIDNNFKLYQQCKGINV